MTVGDKHQEGSDHSELFLPEYNLLDTPFTATFKEQEPQLQSCPFLPRAYLERTER